MCGRAESPSPESQKAARHISETKPEIGSANANQSRVIFISFYPMNADKGCFLHHSFSFALILQIIWVMVPMGQKLHQVLGLNRTFTTKPMMVEVSMML